MKKLILIVVFALVGMFGYSQQTVLLTDTLAVDVNGDPVLIGKISFDLGDLLYAMSGDGFRVFLRAELVAPQIVGASNILSEERREFNLTKEDNLAMWTQHKDLAVTTILPLTQTWVDDHTPINWQEIFPRFNLPAIEE